MLAVYTGKNKESVFINTAVVLLPFDFFPPLLLLKPNNKQITDHQWNFLLKDNPSCVWTTQPNPAH